MSIPIKDINAGDSVSSMVDKINYNFDLIALKGGGARGIQGIQGISGHTGLQGDVGIQGHRGIMFVEWNNSIVEGEPAGANNICGDITISSNGDILEVVNINGELVWRTVQSLTTVSESPFINFSCQAVVEKHTAFPEPIILGVDASDSSTSGKISDILGIQGINRPAIAITALDNTYNPNNPNGCVYNSGIEFFGGTNSNYVDGEISLDNNQKLIVQSRNAITISSNNNSVTFDDNGTRFSKRANLDSDNTKLLLVSTNGHDGILTQDSSWFIDSTHSIVPNSNYGFDIGRKYNSSVWPIKDTYFGTNSKLLFDGENGTNPSLTIGEIGHTTNEEGIVKVKRNGIFLNTEDSSIISSTNGFGIEIFDKNTTKGYANFISFNATSAHDTSIVSQDDASMSTSSIQTFNQKSLNYKVSLGSNNYTSDARINNHISPTITVKGMNTTVANDSKNSAYTITLKGMNGTNVGQDVYISGGDCVNELTSSNKVGGDVYISGGSNIRSNGDYEIDGNLRNFGNVIIGINPNNHPGLHNASNYTNESDIQVNNTKSDPNDVNFFDINDVSVHANKIVIDSNANYRKLTSYCRTTTTGQVPVETFNNPWVEQPELATLQFNGINTLYHQIPYSINWEDATKYQLLSGVMTKTYQFYYDEDNDKINVVDEKKTIDEYDMTQEKTKNSIYLNVEQVWQKVGNTVNVNARCMWFAYHSDKMKFYAITEDMFSCETWYKKILTSNNFYIWSPYNETLLWCITSNYSSRNTPTTSDLAVPSYINIYSSTPKGILTVLENPISINLTRNGFVYGNGAIETSNKIRQNTNVYNNHVINDRQMSLTPLLNNIIASLQLSNPNYNKLHYSVIHSSNVVIGNNTGSGLGFETNSTTLSNYCNFLHGNNGEIHNINSASPSNIQAKSYKSTDKRMNTNVTFTGDWNENTSQIAKSVTYRNNVNYIIPEYNTSAMSRKADSNYACYDYEVSRPCIGLYTSMHVNYSYVLGEGFNNYGKFTQFNKEASSIFNANVTPIYSENLNAIE